TFVSASTAYLNHADASAFQMGTGDFTLSAWAKYTINPSANRFIAAYGQTGNKGYGVGQFGGGLFFKRASGGNPTGTFAGGHSYNDGNWHLVIGIYTGGIIYCYVDNNLEDSQTASDTTTVNNTNNGFNIGNDIDNTSWDGSIDEVGLWNRALTSAERSSL